MENTLVINRVLIALALLTLSAGGIVFLLGGVEQANFVWGAGTGVVLARLVYLIFIQFRSGSTGLDVIAALAMCGSLVLGEPLAGNVIALMFSGGQVLEDFAQARARREMSALLSRTPRRAQRYRGSSLEEIPVDEVQPGDRLLVRPGEVLPVDGYADVKVILDEAVMSGESVPVSHEPGSPIVSGVLNVGGAFDLVATCDSANSTYASIVRLVEKAQASQAPMARLADRYALAFLGVTLSLASIAWVLTGNPDRALAVLVVATPCPLILAVPVAIVAGMSRCARFGILVKDGGALEGLAETKTLVFDKTGTLTVGKPSLQEIITKPGFSEAKLLFLAGSLAQASHHVVSKSLVEAASGHGMPLEAPMSVIEFPGEGVSGRVGEISVVLGSIPFVGRFAEDTPWAKYIRQRIEKDTGLTTGIVVERELVGIVRLADEVRPEALQTLMSLRKIGIGRMVLLTGDRQEVADEVARRLPIDDVIARATPEGKVRSVLNEQQRATTAMVGDGVNDAPALAAARIGIALGARGSSASSEAADVVLLVDTLSRLPEAFFIARRSFAIAWQSVFFGIGLSVIGMLAAAFGYLSPLSGAVAQEVIDVAVILNALRALSGRFPDTSRT